MDINNFESQKREITSPEKFFHFLTLLAEDYRKNRGNWENITIDDYLESIVAWCKDSSFLKNTHLKWEEKPLACIAELFHAGKYYE